MFCGSVFETAVRDAVDAWVEDGFPRHTPVFQEDAASLQIPPSAPPSGSSGQYSHHAAPILGSPTILDPITPYNDVVSP